MNMRVPLSDAELLARRQARTGRAVSTAPGAGAPPVDGAPNGAVDPGTGRPTVPLRDPFDMSGGFDAGLDGGDPTPPPVSPPVSPPAAAQPVLPADLQQQFSTMQQQLDAALGRVVPMQQQLEQYRSTAEALQVANAQLQAQLAEANTIAATRAASEAAASFDPFEGMSPDELAMLDPAVVDAMRRSARASLAKATANMQDPRAIIAQTLQERDARALKAYITNASGELQLLVLGKDPKFQAFLAADDSADMLLNSFVQAPDLETAQRLESRVRKMIKRFRDLPSDTQSGGNPPTPDPQDRLSAHLSRNGAPSAAPGDPSSQQRKALTPEQVQDIRRRAQAFTRQRKFAEAKALLDQLN